MHLSISIAIVCMVAAIVQCLAVADRIAHVTTIAWKVGVEPSLITANCSMIIAFFVLTSLFVGLGLFATGRLRRVASSFRFLSLLSVQLLLAGAVIWGALLCTPFVQIVSR